MIAGGIVMEGEPEYRRSFPVCRHFREISLIRDVDYNGEQGRLEGRIYDKEKCDPEYHHDEYVIESPSAWGYPTSFGGDSRSGFLSDEYVYFELKNTKVSTDDAAPRFHAGDLVEGPFGPSHERARGRIWDIYLEADRSLDYSRTIAELSTQYGLDWFELSALTLISPITDLDAKAEEMLKSFRYSKDFRRRAAVLGYADHACLREPFSKEVEAIEKRLALAFQERIAKLDLDGWGREMLLDKMGEQIGFRERASTLARMAKQKAEEKTPTSTVPCR